MKPLSHPEPVMAHTPAKADRVVALALAGVMWLLLAAIVLPDHRGPVVAIVVAITAIAACHLILVAPVSAVTYGRCPACRDLKHVVDGVVHPHNAYSSGRQQRCAGSERPAQDEERQDA